MEEYNWRTGIQNIKHLGFKEAFTIHILEVCKDRPKLSEAVATTLLTYKMFFPGEDAPTDVSQPFPNYEKQEVDPVTDIVDTFEYLEGKIHPEEDILADFGHHMGKDDYLKSNGVDLNERIRKN